MVNVWQAPEGRVSGSLASMYWLCRLTGVGPCHPGTSSRGWPSAEEFDPDMMYDARGDSPAANNSALPACCSILESGSGVSLMALSS